MVLAFGLGFYICRNNNLKKKSHKRSLKKDETWLVL